MPVKAFAARNFKELVRDPLSYIFCIGLPIVMLVIMTILGRSIPSQAELEIFSLQNQCAGMIVFAFSFVMLFTALLISKDRAGSLLIRLFASPMRSYEFIIGYAIPLALIAVAQILACFGASIILSPAIGESLNIQYIPLCFLVSIPSVILFIGLGIIFGFLFSEKSAPGLSSIIISAAPILGGVWMDLDMIGGQLLAVAKCFPFYYAVSSCRKIMEGNFNDVPQSIMILSIWAVSIFAASIFVFRIKAKEN